MSYQYVRGLPAVERAIQFVDSGEVKSEVRVALAKRKPAPMTAAAVE